MNTSILVDLRKLTPLALREAFPEIGGGDYSGPCIIGSFLTEEERTFLTDWLVVQRQTGGVIEELIIAPGESRDITGILFMSQLDIGRLIEEDVVAVPEGQTEDVIKIQQAFDKSDWEEVMGIAEKYMSPS